MKNKRVLFTDITHPVVKEKLEQKGLHCDFFPDYIKIDYLKIIHKYFGIITRSSLIIDRELIDRAEGLHFIGRLGSGIENIDVDYADKKGIKCFNSPEGNREAVGEHAVGLLIALLRNICSSDKEVRKGLWQREKNRGIEIKDKTIGIIGYGNTGSAFAGKISGFGARVIAYDKYKFDYTDRYVEETSLDDIFNKSNICSIHVPLTEETEYMVNDAFINRFKKNIFLINTARGKVLNTADLVKNMKKGKVLAAALDVLEYEDISFEGLKKDDLPEPYNFLKESDNVILTPHIAGYSNESKYKLGKVLADKIDDYLKRTV